MKCHMNIPNTNIPMPLTSFTIPSVSYLRVLIKTHRLQKFYSVKFINCEVGDRITLYKLTNNFILFT